MQHAPEDIGGRRLSGECPISQSLEIKKCCFVEDTVDRVVLGAQHEKRQSWTPTAAALGPAALHDGHDIWQEAISVLPGDLWGKARRQA